MDKNLLKNIIATVAYYDCLDYPLTSFEVWKYMIKVENREAKNGKEEYLLSSVIEELDGDNIKRYVEKYRGFYFLRDRKDLVGRRINGGKISSRKMKKLRRIIWILRFVPFIRMAGVTGRLAMKNTEHESDWDLLAVIKNRKIWTGRTLITLVTHLMGKRRYKNKIRDRVCLNYFITDESLEIITKDMFSAHEYFFMLPLFDTGVYEKFQLKNRWIKGFKLNYDKSEISNLKMLNDSMIASFVRKTGELLFDWEFLENWLRKWQKEKIMKNPKTHQEGSLIQASDDALIFLPDPQGPKIYEKFKEKVSSLTG